ncbi:fungal-specific transcription factor domain-containing protein [Apodospora peruviana]|uniref:Fungal-specific transcription factor domain-containing protein n=1 Tax=Apodospora peruviana TaxID=516989 RepID=A0AAE0IKB1_9PEZI|nr:fungal-specific transcription factor domain-containing protein [Apodospora peruviana]
MASSLTPASGSGSGFSNPPSQPASVASKPTRILACVLCQHRKIKCDRNFPCANCTKANVKCTPSTPAPARKRRRPNQDLQERLARCEELLKEYATEKPEVKIERDQAEHSPMSQSQTPNPCPSQSPTSRPMTYDDPYLKWHPAGKLVQEDGGVRFMDSYLLGTVYDELRAMREIIDADDNDEVTPDSMTPDDNSDLLLGGESPEQSVENLWPEPAHVFRLWQVYLDRVNPLTKIIHVPTLQPFLAEASSGSHNVPKNIESLLFSIFLMAAVSLTTEECQMLLGYSREEALQRFSSGVRLTLMRMGFLKSHDLTTLQALVIYLISLQGRYNRHAAWILNGVVIRIAQKMGLHRDGEILGLGPFDSEMRRRLWWQIIMVDARYAMLSGLSHSLLPRSWDTKPPKNLNDADIHPSASEPFQDREGPTEMIFCLMTNKFAQFLVNSPGLEAMILATELEGSSFGPEGPSDGQLLECRKTVENLGKELLELLDRYCDPTAGPVHEMAIEMRTHLLKKVTELITPSKLQPDWEPSPRSKQDNAFKIAVGSLEHNESNYISAKDRGFIWFSLAHFQLDVFLYMAGQLCHRTDGPLVERAWKQVGVVFTFHPELLDVSTNKTYQTLAIFILKAWKRREEHILSQTGRLPETPFYVEKLRLSIPSEAYISEATPPVFTPAYMRAPRGPVAAGGSDPVLDQFFGGYLDTTALDWDMFGNMPMGGVQSNGPFAGFGLGPAAEW